MNIIDCRGMVCPDPLNILRKNIRNLPSGAIITILSDDPASKREIPAFCNFIGHELVQMPANDAEFTYIVKKK